MGANHSKSLKHRKGGQVLGSGPQQTPQQPQQGKGDSSTSPQTVGAGGKGSAPAKPSSQQPQGRTQGGGDDPRAAAAEAAERRMKAQQERGTNSSNPKQGHLAAQVGRQNSKGTLPPSSNQKDDLVWD